MRAVLHRPLTALLALAAATIVVVPRAVEGGQVHAAEQAGPASVALEGRGYGHGRGLSQYGAQGAATQHGKTHRQILRFYYPGTAWGKAVG